MSINLFSIEPEGFKELTLPKGKTFAECNCLRWSGESKSQDWVPANLEWLEDELSSEGDVDADFIKFSGSVVVSEKAFDVLSTHLSALVEFLPVNLAGGQRYIMNVTNVLDIMDKEKSKFKIYSDGDIGMCEHAYIVEPDSGQLIYQVSGFLGRIFINETLDKLISSNKLTGALIREYKNP